MPDLRPPRSAGLASGRPLDPAAVALTRELTARLHATIAYGRTGGLLEHPLFWGEDGVFPYFAVEAEGCTIVNSAGQSYVDWVNGFGPVILGYRRSEVEDAIKRQLAAGPTLSLMHPIEVEVAELVVEMVPCAETVAFGKNGSDVLSGAIRVARAATGRDLVLHHGFHGFHEWSMCEHPLVEGIPEIHRSLVRSFPYNDLGALSELFERHMGEVAVVVMEPVNTRLPEPGYLEGVLELTHRHGALLVFDELITGFRLANGGAQEHFGVTPDLACLGKALANGMPLAALAGRADHMKLLTRVGYGMTFRGEALSLAAARATLEILRDEPVCERLAQIGAHVRERFDEMCGRTGVDCRLVGPDPRLTFSFADDGGIAWDELRLLFVQECLKAGVMTNGNLLPSFALTDAAIERSLEGFERALTVVARAVEHGSATSEGGNGPPAGRPRPLLANGFVNVTATGRNKLQVNGWMLVSDAPPDRIELVLPDGTREAAEPVKRPDIAAAFPQIARAEDAGYAALVPLDALASSAGHEFTILAWHDGDVAFRCDVVRPAGDGQRSAPGPHWIGHGVVYF